MALDINTPIAVSFSLMNRARYRPVHLLPCLAALGGLAWSVVCATDVHAADPLILELQRELKAMFPVPAPTTSSLALLKPESPYAIVSQEVLLALAPGLPDSTEVTSLRKIRQAPPAVRNAHAACVKIITPYWHGAGILVSPEGDVLTSYHLVAGVPCASVLTLDGRIHTVSNITAASAVHDLALLRIPGGPYVTLPVSSATGPEPGEPLTIVGHPGETVWKSVPGTALRCNADRGTQVLHFDAPVARGNSGGPVVDGKGQLVAVTACAAELADGSKVKVGIAPPAIRAFLSSPRLPMDFADLTRIEQNRRLADFLGQVCLLMDMWINDWLASMALVTVEEAPGTPGQSGPRIRFMHTRQAAEISARLILLKAMLLRCGLADSIDPILKDSIASSSRTLDALMDGALLLSGNRGISPEATRSAMKQVSQFRQEANRHFGQALSGIRSSAAQYELDVSDPVRFKQISAMKTRHESVGCRFDR